MREMKVALVACAAVVVAVLASDRFGLSAQGSVALTGVVSSAAEGTMEGVIVTARGEDADFDVSVVSDAEGRYSFPSTHLAPGAYDLKIRAVGYELPAPTTASVTAGNTATADLALEDAADISRQLTSVEWAMNLPDSPDKDKMMLQAASCAYCHNIERIVRTTYTAEQWPAVITRMQKYYLDGSAYGYEGRVRAVLETLEAQERAENNPNWGYWPELTKVDLGKYLATVNRSDGKSLPTEFETLPRPTGAETQVIITQYDMPRRGTIAHDGDLDASGDFFWYTDQSALFIGRLDTRTGAIKEWAVPPTTKSPAGTSDIVIDPDGYVWFPATSDLVNGTFGVIMRFDPRTETFEPVKNMPQGGTQFLGLDGNGKLWSGFGPWYRIDRKTNTFERSFNIREAPNRPPDATGGGYQMEVDSRGNPALTDFVGGYIARMDAETETFRFIKVPTKDGMPRRGRMDAQDRFWFSIYRGDKIGVLNPDDTIREYELPFKYFTPYTTSAPDSRGRVFASSNTSDRLARVDIETGETITYLMPTRDFDTKKIAIDPKDGKTVWFANKRAARVVKVEPLD